MGRDPSNRRQRLLSALITVAGLTATTFLDDIEVTLIYALLAIPPLLCIWVPEYVGRLGETLVVLVFDRFGAGLIGESAHYAGWLMLIAWCGSITIQLFAAR